MADHTYFDDLKTSLEQAIAFENGDKRKARSTVREVSVAQYDAADVVQFRQHFNLTQKGLATVLGVSQRTVEAWETGKNKPNGSANKLMYLMNQDSALINQLITRQ